MRLCLTVVILVSMFIRRYVVSQKTTSYYDEEYEDNKIRVRHLHSEIDLVRQMMTVQERQLSEMRILLEAVHRFMEQLLTNDCFKSQPKLRHNYLTSGTRQSHDSPGRSGKEYIFLYSFVQICSNYQRAANNLTTYERVDPLFSERCCNL